ncbi:hypothetical protein [Paenibacillus sp. NEAU-GSW1]|uniref:hypothetical protein n=1 Tax=Paenibacillus sp. NEAU-GSW1 TaxID=2682486 RepID=UPI0012E2AC13|nr:hypothetical protein [Paenibacillus sp. NEAU-GSW1]MUT66044.1 hypothetical protein [Paenibacillus sp. NEAU-GSW1]
MKKLDKDKLLEWLNEQYDDENFPISQARAYQRVIREIQSDRFDIKEEQSND